MSQQDIAKVHHYSARIPDSDYARARAKCDKLGISMNTGLIHALRHWCKTTDSAVPIPVHAKLSDVIGGMLQEMEARIIEALKPKEMMYTLSYDPELADGMENVPYPPLAHRGFRGPTEAEMAELIQLREHLKSIKDGAERDQGMATAIGTRAASTREGASFVMPNTTTEEQYERQVEKAKRLGLGYGTGKPTQFTTVPERLNWDTPAPQHRLWPENPPVNSLAPRPLDGQVWVVTGDFDTMTTSRVREILSEAGAAVASQVSKKTSAVLAGYSGEKEVLSAGEFRMLPIWGELQFLHMAKFIGADVRIPE